MKKIGIGKEILIYKRILKMNFSEFIEGKKKVCVIGLGYVGLPLALLLAKKFKVIGFDANLKRINELKQGFDRTKEFSNQDLKKFAIKFSNDEKVIKECDLIIVAVPTPIDKLKDPDLSYVKKASKIVGKNLKKGAIVVFESTVWPGLTEEICVPILEKESGMKWKKDFFVGYSPERVNLGDKEHTIEKIVKIVAGDTPETAKLLARIYGAVIKAGVYVAPNIKTAEAAKVIENIQRDLNIALMNELSLIFHRLGIDTKEVLKAAGTKWNFLKFEPGLVGGHCIGVDPYYLAYKAKEVGYIPQLILAGRNINESIPKFVAEETVKLLVKAKKKINGSKILMLGFTFKENVPDVRNTKVYDLVKVLWEFGVETIVYDPVADKEITKAEYGIDLVDDYKNYIPYDAVIVAVRHEVFRKTFDITVLKKLCSDPCILIDIKGLYSRKKALEKGIIYWRL